MTDNGSAYRSHDFRDLCGANRLRHIRTRPYTPKTTDVIDKSFLCEPFSPGARVTAWRRAGREVEDLPRSLYRRTSVAVPVRSFLGPRGFQPVTKRA
jgi:transposase InsO family protein